VSLKMGFLYMDVTQLVGVLWMVMSREFMLLLDSYLCSEFHVGVDCVQSMCMLLMSVWLGS